MKKNNIILIFTFVGFGIFMEAVYPRINSTNISNSESFIQQLSRHSKVNF